MLASQNRRRAGDGGNGRLANNPDLAAGLGPPPLRLWWGEARALTEFLGFAIHRRRLLRGLPQGHRHVLVFPGLLMGDGATAPLRGVLSALGHQVEGWGLGRNLGLRPGRFEEIETRFTQFAAAAHAPVALVGWSLGGLYAVELARRYPEQVHQIITLGSPVSGMLRANHAWSLYERLARHPIDNPPIKWQPGATPPVPLCAIAAREDGIVHTRAAHARPGPTVKNLLVAGTHCGLPWNREAIRCIAEQLADR